MVNYVPRGIPAIAEPLPGIQEPISIRQWQGLNTFDPYSIAESQLTDMSNMSTSDYPALSVRTGFSVLGTFGSRILGMGAWKSELHVIANDGGWHRWNGSTWTTLLTGLDTSAEWSFTVFQGDEWADINLIGVNGIVAKRYDGSTVVDLAGVPAGAKYITTYENRMWVAFKNEIRACALDQPEKWDLFEGTDEDSYGRVIESTRGENVNMLNGSLTKLTIGMPNSLHELYGGVPSSFVTKLITDNVGVLNNKSVSAQDGIMRIIDQRAIYDYAGGNLPNQEFSQIVGGYLNSMDANTSSGSDPDLMYFRTHTNEIMVYDSRTGVGCWSRWTNIDPTFFLLLDDVMYIGDSLGRVLKLDSSTNDAGSPVSWSFTTKPFTNPTMSQRQRWLKLWLYAEIPVGTTINIYLSTTKDGNDFTLVHTVTGSGSKVERIIIPVRSVVLENTVRVKISGTGSAKIHELVRQIRQLSLF
ncbi:hypothetical protein BK125_04780 [Paenibacillus odorifer]|uniref:Phage tail protein n=1 Tax=Paenibacillus odorifer TaxID=189426 RepID=A0ABX3GSM8_9BACL|nr:hypothetical protein [Paenibacillus odorifer]OMC79598.1 hypothetical protein BK125_04780 [Paenibacillus odorifer]OMD34944.1 hypothetical protein BSO21_10025 [Paenibacillus odorifer]